jgi:hypothetical protein
VGEGLEHESSEQEEVPVEEEWRGIGGFSYEVSNLGRVRRTNRRVLRQYKVRNRNGDIYLRVDLWRWNRVHFRYVHRLVASAFLPAPGPLRREVNHIDTDTQNNAASNLEWVTHSENEAHKRFWEAPSRIRRGRCIVYGEGDRE